MTLGCNNNTGEGAACVCANRGIDTHHDSKKFGTTAIARLLHHLARPQRALGLFEDVALKLLPAEPRAFASMPRRSPDWRLPALSSEAW